MSNSKTMKTVWWILAFILIALVVAILILGLPRLRQDPNAANKLIDEAQTLFSDYEFAKAMSKYRKAMEVDSGNSQIYLGMSEIYLLKNRISDAKDVLEVGRKNARDKSRILEELGRIALLEFDYKSALEYLESAHRADSQNHSAKYYLSLAYVANAQLDEARRYLDIPEEVGDLWVRSELLKAILLGNRTDAASRILSSIAKAPISDEDLKTSVSNYQALLEKVQSLDSEERSEKYVDVILASGALEFGYPHVVLNRLERYKDDDEYWELSLYLGWAYYLTGDVKSASGYLKNSSVLNPVGNSAPWILGRINEQEGDISAMSESYLRAISVSQHEDKVSIRKEYAVLLVKHGKYGEAVDQYEILIAEDPDNLFEYQLLQAEVYMRRDLPDEANIAIGKINESALPDELLARLYYLRAWIHLVRSDLDISRNWVDQAISLDASVPEYRFVSGQLYFESGDVDKARKEFERSIDLDLEGSVSIRAERFLDRL